MRTRTDNSFMPGIERVQSGTESKTCPSDLWQSRAMGDIFIPNYVAHGLTSLIGRGDFIEKMNFYEQIGYFHHWYE